MRRIGFVTYPGIPDLSPDDRLAMAPLLRSGLVAEPVLWGGAGVRWTDYAAIVIRSCWDYHLQPDAFASWIQLLEDTGVALWNPPGLLRWNMNKTYLRELESSGVAIPPTIWLTQGESADLGSLLDRARWLRAVVKPTISGSAYSTWITTAEEAVDQAARFRRMVDAGGVMVQRFEEEVIRGGEWSLVFFLGQVSHAVIKRVKPGDFRVQREHGGSSEAAEPSPTLVGAAERILARVKFPWLYAQVDLIEVDGSVLLMELEMLEPDLFLRLDPAAPDRFAAAIASVVR